MKLDLSPQEVSRLAKANGERALAQIMHLYDHPEAMDEIPDGSHVFTVTGDAWVDEQNRLMAEQLEAEGKTVVLLNQSADAQGSLEYSAL